MHRKRLGGRYPVTESDVPATFSQAHRRAVSGAPGVRGRHLGSKDGDGETQRERLSDHPTTRARATRGRTATLRPATARVGTESAAEQRSPGDTRRAAWRYPAIEPGTPWAATPERTGRSPHRECAPRLAPGPVEPGARSMVGRKRVDRSDPLRTGGFAGGVRRPGRSRPRARGGGPAGHRRVHAVGHDVRTFSRPD
jgi:hypothetical protein